MLLLILLSASVLGTTPSYQQDPVFIYRLPEGGVVYQRRSRLYVCSVPQSYQADVQVNTSVRGGISAGRNLGLIETNARIEAERAKQQGTKRVIVRPDAVQASAVEEFDTCLQYLFGGFTDAEFGAYLRCRRGMGCVQPVQLATTPAPPAPAFPLRATILDPDGYTNVRRGPSTADEIVTKVFDGEVFFTRRDRQSNWWRVRTKDGLTGYMHVSRIHLLD
jgi:hypothetical protein